MADEFPYSDSKLIDEAAPSDGTLGSALDDEVRKTRRGINYLWDRATIRHFRHVDLVPLVQSLSVKGDKILEMDMAETPHTLVQLTGGYAGQVIYVTVADDDEDVTGKELILHHNNQYIKLRDAQDFHMQRGDVSVLRNVGGNIDSEEDGYWEEWFREIAGSLLGMVSPNGDRYQLTVSDQGALVVTEV